MSEKWHKPAWEIDPRTPAVFWYIRAQFVWNERNKAEKEEYDRAKKSRRRRG